MAKEQTDISKYPSRYSPSQFVTAAQYIIELVCEKKALAQGKDLPMQFWKLKEWQMFFVSQLRMCHKLIKQYSERAIIDALKDKRAYKVNSLFAPWLIPIIEEKHAILICLKPATLPSRNDTEPTTRTPFSRVKTQLADLDG